MDEDLMEHIQEIAKFLHHVGDALEAENLSIESVEGVAGLLEGMDFPLKTYATIQKSRNRFPG